MALLSVPPDHSKWSDRNSERDPINQISAAGQSRHPRNSLVPSSFVTLKRLNIYTVPCLASRNNWKILNPSFVDCWPCIWHKNTLSESVLQAYYVFSSQGTPRPYLCQEPSKLKWPRASLSIKLGIRKFSNIRLDRRNSLRWRRDSSFLSRPGAHRRRHAQIPCS